MLCGIRRRASWFNHARPGSAFAYRFDYWLGAQSLQLSFADLCVVRAGSCVCVRLGCAPHSPSMRYSGNANCTAVPNFHLPYLGAAHQDEVTFVLGQPNFMEDGSCCGVWGLTTPDCPHLDRCEACYAPDRFGHDGYRAYFNDKEWAFARTVGKLWTNVAASGDPNCRDSACANVWPKFASGEVTKNLGGV